MEREIPTTGSVRIFMSDVHGDGVTLIQEDGTQGNDRAALAASSPSVKIAFEDLRSVIAALDEIYTHFDYAKADDTEVAGE